MDLGAASTGKGAKDGEVLIAVPTDDKDINEASHEGFRAAEICANVRATDLRRRAATACRTGTQSQASASREPKSGGLLQDVQDQCVARLGSQQRAARRHHLVSASPKRATERHTS